MHDYIDVFFISSCHLVVLAALNCFVIVIYYVGRIFVIYQTRLKSGPKSGSHSDSLFVCCIVLMLNITQLQ